MTTFLKWLVGLLAVLVAVVVGGAYLIPPVAVVERATVIEVPPERIYAIVGRLKRFNEWSPWAELDPATQYSFEGPDSGIGQKMKWTSANPDVGSGSQTIVEAVTDSKVVTDLDLGDMGKAQTILALSPNDKGTAVVWTFRTDVPGVAERWMSLMFDKWIGADYAKGLAKLKALAEKDEAGG